MAKRIIGKVNELKTTINIIFGTGGGGGRGLKKSTSLKKQIPVLNYLAKLRAFLQI